MKLKILVSLALAFFFTLSTFGYASADTHLPACPEGDLTGTVLSYDETTGEIVLQTSDGQCVSYIDSTYDHPITSLFDDYFGTDNSGDLTDAATAGDDLQ